MYKKRLAARLAQNALILSSAFFALTISATGHAKEQCYTWTNEKGGKEFGNIPPVGVTVETAECKHKSAAPDVNSEFDAETLAKKRKAREEREAQCNDERSRLSTLKTSGARIRMVDPDGTPRYLTAEEIQNEIDASQKFISQNCK